MKGTRLLLLLLVTLLVSCEASSKPQASQGVGPPVNLRINTPASDITPSQPTVSVPSVLYDTLSSARSSVRAEGLKFKVAARVFTVTWRPNTVVSQHPDPDTEVAPGTVVSLTLSKAPACHPSYDGACLKPFVGDYDCANGPGDGPNYLSNRVTVVGPDVFKLDKDHDGIGCDQLPS